MVWTFSIYPLLLVCICSGCSVKEYARDNNDLYWKIIYLLISVYVSHMQSISSVEGRFIKDSPFIVFANLLIVWFILKEKTFEVIS
jgi:hypothetical protein